MKTKRPHTTGNRRSGGVTLVEVIVTLLIFSILLTFGIGFGLYATKMTIVNRDRVLALTLANQRMEQLQAQPPFPVPNVYYVKNTGTLLAPIWEKSTDDPNETVNINGVDKQMITKVNYVTDRDYLLADVTIKFKTNPDDDVRFQTYIGRH